MLRLTLTRDTFLEHATLGTLTDGISTWQTLEDTDRRLEENVNAKIPGQTAIPRGTYPLVLAYSSRFMRILPRLLDVPGFEGVLIHAGNTATDTAGCVLVGEERSGEMILRSKDAMKRLMGVLWVVYELGEIMSIEVR